MIAYVKGSLEEVAQDNVVIDVNGIGYNVKVSTGTVNQLPGLHSEVKLYTFTYVREDAFWLFGFMTKEDLEIFRLLITVNGIGPKGALGILSAISPQELRFAVAAADSKTIAKAPGIGKKTAERVILDLRDKISLEDGFAGGTETALKDGGTGTGLQGARNEAVEALVALGYSSSEALKAVNRVETDDRTDVEMILKAALKHMF